MSNRAGPVNGEDIRIVNGTLGELSEWSIEAVLKTVEHSLAPWVRILHSPQSQVQWISSLGTRTIKKS